jgi:adenine-specific DNA-methyltransferase
LKNKPELLKRKIKKFNQDNWFMWGAPRNIKVMEDHKGSDCIYINNITRKTIIAFKGKVQYFGGSLIMLKPKENTDAETIDKTVAHLNSTEFKKIFTYSGRFKIGHRQLSKSFIDI